MSSGTYLPHVVDTSADNNWNDADNLKNANGEAYRSVANGDKRYVDLYFFPPLEGDLKQITGAPSIALECKSNRDNASLYKTRPIIGTISYYTASGSLLTSRSWGWQGAQTLAKQAWQTYNPGTDSTNISAYTKPIAGETGAWSRNIISYIVLSVGVEKYSGALADRVYLRNVKATFNWKAVYQVTLYSVEGSTDYTVYGVSDGAAMVMPTPTQEGKIFTGWYDSSGTLIVGGGQSYTPTSSTRLYAHYTVAPSGGLYVGASAATAYLGATQAHIYLGNTLII